MSTRQYIGARYVPKFFDWDGSAEWRSGVAYEALTIVTRNGNSYTSKIPVPSNIGAPESNPTYWVATGLYNEQLESIRDAILSAQGDINTLDGRMDTAEGDIDTLETGVSGLGTRMNTAEGDIDTLQSNVSSLGTRMTSAETEIGLLKNDSARTELVLIGDSWADYEHDQENVRIPTVLHNQLGVTVHNYAYGGTGFDAQHGYFQQAQDFIADTSFDHNKIKCFVLVLGINEYHSSTETSVFSAKLDQLVNTLKGNVDRPVYWFHNYSLENTVHGLNCQFYPQFNYYNALAQSLHSKCIAVNTFGWVSAWNTANYYHPNSTGSVAFAENMVKTINGAEPVLYIYDSHEDYWASETVAQGFRKVTTYYYVQGSKLFAESKIPMGGLGVVPNNTAITFTRPHPARYPGNMHLGCGVIDSEPSSTGFKFLVQNSGERTWTTSMSGTSFNYFECE